MVGPVVIFTLIAGISWFLAFLEQMELCDNGYLCSYEFNKGVVEPLFFQAHGFLLISTALYFSFQRKLQKVG